jgi:hypothetical protein
VQLDEVCAAVYSAFAPDVAAATPIETAFDYAAPA